MTACVAKNSYVKYCLVCSPPRIHQALVIALVLSDGGLGKEVVSRKTGSAIQNLLIATTHSRQSRTGSGR